MFSSAGCLQPLRKNPPQGRILNCSPSSFYFHRLLTLTVNWGLFAVTVKEAASGILLIFNNAYPGLDFSFQCSIIHLTFRCAVVCTWSLVVQLLITLILWLWVFTGGNKEAGCSPHTFVPSLLFTPPLLLVCVHDRLLPWFAPPSSWNRSRETTRIWPRTIPTCTEKRLQSIAATEARPTNKSLQVFFPSVCELLIVPVFALN